MILCVKSDEKIPRYFCDKCYDCHSAIAESLCKFKHRGCCFYYP